MNGWTVSLILFFGVVNFCLLLSCFNTCVIEAGRQISQLCQNYNCQNMVLIWTDSWFFFACILMEYTFI